MLERTDVDEAGIAPFMPEVFHKLDWLDKEDIIKRFVTIEFGRFLKYYANAPEIEEPALRGRGAERKQAGDKPRRKRRETGVAEEGYARFFLSLGKKDHLYPRELLGMLNKMTRRPVDVGRIDLKQNFSFFEVPEDQAKEVEQALRNLVVDGRRVTLERATPASAAYHRGKPSYKERRGGNYAPSDGPRTKGGKRYKPFHKNKK